VLNVAIASARSAFPPRAQLNLDPPFFLGLLIPAVLLSLLKKCTLLIAPRYGVYFTAEAVTILYAYFALARAVYIHSNGRTRDGRYDRSKAAKAEQDFHRALPSLRSTLARIALPLLALGAIADVVTSGGQTGAIVNVATALILFVEMAVWLRFGPAFVVMCQRWTVLKPPNPAFARRLVWANRAYVVSSFVMATLVFAVVSVLGLKLFYEPLRALVVAALPSWTAIFLYSTLFGAVIAGFAFWVQCQWSAAVAAKLVEQEPVAT
jgi:hypothetical protein